MSTPRPKRLLVMRTSALGDVAMTLPVVYSVARRWQGALEVWMLTSPFCSRLLVNAPGNLHTIMADFKGPHRGARGMWRLLRQLQAMRFDLVADLHNVSRSWVADRWLSACGARVAMVDKMRSTRRQVLTGGAAHPDITQRYADVFSRLGFPPGDEPFGGVFAGAPAPAPPVAVESPAVGIAPFARYANKAWPLDHASRLARLLAGSGVSVYLFGGRGREAELLEQMAAVAPAIHNVAGRFTLPEELALMHSLGCMVSMDSANQHLASLAGIPVVTVWGSTVPACGFQPYGQPRDRGLAAGLPCQPCSIAGGDGCPAGLQMQCLAAVTPEAVVARVMSIINTTPRP